MDRTAFIPFIEAQDAIIAWAVYSQTLASQLLQAHFPVGFPLVERTTGREYHVVEHEFSKKENQIIALCKQKYCNKGTPRHLTLQSILTDFEI
jgi:hypothetical protein